MKIIFKLAVLLLFLIPIVYADIQLNSLDGERYNLGDRVSFSGYLQEPNAFTGTIEIMSVCGNETKVIFFSLLSLDYNEKYGFSQDINVDEKPNTCYFDVVVKGEDGSIEQEKSSEYIITKELRVEAEADILTQKPGNDVIISGIIRKANGLRISDGSVALTFNNKVYGTGLSDGAFSYRITLPGDVASGEQVVDIQARDLKGNEGTDQVKFRVISVPEDLDIEIDKEVYLPGDKVLVKISLNDQSNKNIPGSSTLQLVDSNGNIEMTKIVENGADFEILLNEITLPGTWMIKAESNDFRDNKRFYVEEVKDKEILMQDDKIIIKNIGNVDYNEPIQIDLMGEDEEEFKVIKKTSLKPNQTIMVDLNDEVPGGEYEVKIGGNLITGNVILEGNAIANLKENTTVGYFALVFIFLFLIFIIVSKGRRRLSSRKIAREKGKEIILKRNDVKKDDFVRARKEDIEYVLNKVKQESIEKEKSKSPDKGNPFDIFN